MEHLQQTEQRGGKRRRLTLEERKQRCRERNRMHARKTREKKKYEFTVLQQRVNALHEEGAKLRQMVDEHYTAVSLLDLGRPSEDGKPRVTVKQSGAICGDSYQEIMIQSLAMIDESTHPLPGSRRHGKYTAQERVSMRRARNRMHAKRTRDRKKAFFDVCEQAIYLMEKENETLREYLLKVDAISEAQAQESTERESAGKEEADRILQGNYSVEARSTDDGHDSTESGHRSKRTRSDDDDHDNDHDHDHEEVDDEEAAHSAKAGSSQSSEDSEPELQTTLPKLAPRTSSVDTPTTESAAPHPTLVSKLPPVPYPVPYLRPRHLYEYPYPTPYVAYGINTAYDHRIHPAGAIAYLSTGPHPSSMLYASAPAEYTPYPILPF